MAMFLMEERTKTDSVWRPWIEMLPNNFEDFPVFFTSQQKKWLTETALLLSLEKKINNMKNEFAFICGKIPAFTKFTYLEYQGARMMANSRMFELKIGGKKTLGWVPYADMMNYTDPPDADFEYDDKQGGYILKACHAIKKGQVVHNTYGPKSNRDYYLHYGFIHPNNNRNNLPVIFDVSKDDPLYSKKMALLQNVDMNDSRAREYMAMANYNLNCTSKMIAFLRFCVYNEGEEELEKVCQ
jgi:histone-lysine N-methyltransferase SETD3